MKITVISDTHLRHNELVMPPADVLIHCGDYSGRGTREELGAFNSWLRELPYKYKLINNGNHDKYSQIDEGIEDYYPAKDLLINGAMLIDQEVAIEGKRFYFSPWTPEFFNWAWMKKRGPQIKSMWDKIPEGLDVLVTHGPPFGILDKNQNGENCGCEELLKAVQRVRPKFHLFGHIHESYGQVEIDGTTFINAANLNEHYKYTNKPVVFEI
jgi:predicted phosphodiesterase